MISTDENRVVAAVQEWNQNDTYNLYVSETAGVFYTLALENVVSSMGHEGNVMVDLYEVHAHAAGRHRGLACSALVWSSLLWSGLFCSSLACSALAWPVLLCSALLWPVLDCY